MYLTEQIKKIVFIIPVSQFKMGYLPFILSFTFQKVFLYCAEYSFCSCVNGYNNKLASLEAMLV